MKKVIYARVSTTEQNVDQQAAYLLQKHTNAIVYKEMLTGKSIDRPVFNKAIKTLVNGDTLIVKELSRIGRSTTEVINAIEQLTEQGIKLIIDKENIDTSTPTGKFMITVLAGMAQMERELMLERQKIGIATAKADGKYKGRKATNDHNCIKALELIDANPKMTKEQASKAVGIGVATLYRYVSKKALS